MMDLVPIDLLVNTFRFDFETHSVTTMGPRLNNISLISQPCTTTGHVLQVGQPGPKPMLIHRHSQHIPPLESGFFRLPQTLEPKTSRVPKLMQLFSNTPSHKLYKGLEDSCFQCSWDLASSSLWLEVRIRFYLYFRISIFTCYVFGYVDRIQFIIMLYF